MSESTVKPTVHTNCLGTKREGKTYNVIIR